MRLVADAPRAICWRERARPPDVLVNSAGITRVNKPTDEIAERERDKVMVTNVKGVLFCTNHAIPYMKWNGGGSIINPDDIGSAVVNLASDQAKFVAGSELVVDRGYTAQ